ncbi:VOC family protein [Microcoleus sp. FACHB-831]|uniref:VOC family protein n=1 Tax=Microcoleus sp. FACHB-831 TaxID=2692827 RepID=UPI001685E1DA|nr:VOC family protein [Microcoleus sp. FACHB-831]MBD1923779.1 VOC family protein [Microcoleus sp. FACHB-831]
MNQVLFHLAFPVTNIAQTKAFYADGLGCEVGRESPSSIILNLYGHQIVAHVTHEPLAPQRTIYPRHFGLVFTQEADWENLLARAQEKKLNFREQPRRRFEGLPTEHRTFFLEDPFHNLLEFKFYCHSEAIFGDREFALVGDRV